MLYGIGHGAIEVLNSCSSIDSALTALHVTEKNAAFAMQSFRCSTAIAGTAVMTVLKELV